ncbi:MAG TPA: hypothetical protein ACFE0H_08270 [Elainellaceae cyanobacterium]
MALLLILCIGLTGCGDRPAKSKTPRSSEPAKTVSTRKLSEVSPPDTIQELRPALDTLQPQVTILRPRSGEVLQDTVVTVELRVQDLPAFKNEEYGLGPHLHVILDNQPYRAVYDPSKPLVFEDLEPGTHTIRAFASRPWHESFKNEGAFAQTTFHIFTETSTTHPSANQPLITYSRPKGTYGAEPILLDFYLTNAPLHLVAQESAQDDILDWKIRCTVNGQSFTFDRWQPIYLKGFKTGRNWIQLELLDENDALIPNVYNNTARLITLEPNGQDTLSKLVRGELSASELRGIVDPNYKPEPPTTEPSEVERKPKSIPEPEPTPTSPESKPSPEPTPSPEVSPEVESEAPKPSEPNPSSPKSAQEPTEVIPSNALPSSESEQLESEPIENPSVENELNQDDTAEPAPDTDASSNQSKSQQRKRQPSVIEPPAEPGSLPEIVPDMAPDGASDLIKPSDEIQPSDEETVTGDESLDELSDESPGELSEPTAGSTEETDSGANRFFNRVRRRFAKPKQPSISEDSINESEDTPQALDKPASNDSPEENPPETNTSGESSNDSPTDSLENNLSLEDDSPAKSLSESESSSSSDDSPNKEARLSEFRTER